MMGTTPADFDAAVERGWDEKTMLRLACLFIRNRNLQDEFGDYLEQTACAERAAECGMKLTGDWRYEEGRG